MGLRISLTGVLTLQSEGYYTDESLLGGNQGRLLWAFLVAERHRAVERDELAEVLWPNELPASWEPSLRTVVSKVRRSFASAGLPADDVLTHAFGCYQLHLPDDTLVDIEELVRDVERAEHALRSANHAAVADPAERAAAVASSAFLPGSAAPWVERKRAELRSWLVRALEALAEGQLATGDPAAAVGPASEALTVEPFRESAVRSLMRAHQGCGNTAEGLRCYERCREMLADELGVDPSPQTEAIYLELLRQDPSHRTPAEPSREQIRTAPRSPRFGGSHDRFVGRARELSSIQDACEDARGGRLRLVLIEGEPGIGKTRLAAEVARTVDEQGGFVLYGRCADGLAIPYLPFVEALQGFILRWDPGQLETSLGPLAGELTRLVPTLPHHLPSLPAPLHAEAETERYRLFEAVSGWLATASQVIPLILVADDLHWADAPTLHLFRHVLRSLDPMHVCLVGTYRSTDLDTQQPLVPFLADIRAMPVVQRITLTGLNSTDVGSMLGDQQVADVTLWVHAQTDGNPLYATELHRHLVDSGVIERRSGGWEIVGRIDDAGVPSELRQLVNLRASRLPSPAADVLAIASVLGFEFDVGLLIRLCDHSEDAVLDALDHARRVGLVDDVERKRDRCAFVHALVRTAIYDGLSVPRRMRMHLRAARALEAMAGPDVPLAELAHHYAEAAPLGEEARAVRYLMLAGEQARTGLAFEQAAAHFERALRVLDDTPHGDGSRRCDLEIALGEALHRSGDARHRDVLIAAADRARTMGDAERLGRAGLALNKMGSPSSAGAEDRVIVDILDDALAGLPEEDSPLRARLMATLAGELVWRVDMGRRRELGEAARAMARRLGPEVLAEVVYPAHFATSGPDNLDERIAQATELIETAARIGDREQICRGHMVLVDALIETGDVDAADEAMVTAERLIAELRQPYMSWEVVMRRAGRELLAGRLADVDKLVQEAFDLGVERNVPESLLTAVFGSQLLMLRFEQGELEELVPFVATVADLSPTWGPTILSFVYTQTDRPDDARPWFAEAMSTIGRDRDIQWLAGVVMLAQVCASLGDRAAAGALYPVLLPYAGRMSWVTSVACGPTDLGLGVLADLSDDPAAAIAHFSNAAALCQRMGAEGWLARTRCAWAFAVSGSDPRAARTLATEAVRSAESRGQIKLADQGRRLLDEAALGL